METIFGAKYQEYLLKSQKNVLELWLNRFNQSLDLNYFNLSEHFCQNWDYFEAMMRFHMATQAIEMDLAINLQRLYWDSYFKLMRQSLTQPPLRDEKSANEHDQLYIERELMGGSFHLVDSN